MEHLKGEVPELFHHRFGAKVVSVKSTVPEELKCQLSIETEFSQVSSQLKDQDYAVKLA